MAKVKASSSTEGFFQQIPVVPPLFTSRKAAPSSSRSKNVSDDQVFDRVMHLYLPINVPDKVVDSIHDISRVVLHPSTLKLTVDCETNHPSLQLMNTFGEVNKVDPLKTSEGWRSLQKIGVKCGSVALGYESQYKGIPATWNRRVHQFAIVHVWTGSAALVMCPASMTDGAAKLISRHLQDPDGDQPGRQAVFKEAYARLTSFDPDYAWTSGQWMTERTGGSDVRNTETIARRLSKEELEAEKQNGRTLDAHGMPLGPWKIDGFKWFSSATDSNMAVMLAQTEKGLSAFFTPMRRKSGNGAPAPDELNGIRISRLKNKMGTKGLPTAELELVGARGWLIGEEGKGIKEITTILNMTRIHTAVGSLGYWARCISVSRAYTKSRKVATGLLEDNPQHLRWMAAETVKYWAAVHLTFFVVALFGASEQEGANRGTRAENLLPQDHSEIEALVRLLTSVIKAQVSVQAVLGIRENMESLGGVGYCENNEDGGILNLARLFRDAAVQPIWEGTVSIMAEDTARVLKDKRIGSGNVLENVFAKWVRGALGRCQSKGKFTAECRLVNEKLEGLISAVRQMDVHHLHWEGRMVLRDLEAITCAVLLMYDACIDDDEVACEIARRWIASRVAPDSGSAQPRQDWKSQVAMAKRIFLGPEEKPAPLLGKL